MLFAPMVKGWILVAPALLPVMKTISVGFKGVPLRSFAPFVVNDFSEIWEGFEHTSARELRGCFQTT